MTDDRAPFREARDAGLRQRHEQRLARAQRPDVKAATPLEVQHITAECRTNKNLYPAWFQAVSELLEVYYAQVERYPDATISLAIYRTVPEETP